MKLNRLALLSVLAGLAGGVALTGCVRVAPAPVPTKVAPDPQPTPPPPPAPEVKPAGVVIVENPASGKVDQARGDFLTDPRVVGFFKASNLQHALYSVNAIGPDGQPVRGRAGDLIAAARASGVLPHFYVIAADGAVLRDGKLDLSDPAGWVASFDAHKDAPRAMGCRNEAPRLKWTEFGSAAVPTTQVIDRARWRPVDLEAFLPPVHDQDGKGQCNMSATGSGIETGREIGGMSYVALSAGDGYSQVNGGRDDGSTLEDGLSAAVNGGFATAKTVPYVWDGRNHGASAKVKAERAMYRARDVFLCPSFDHVASALQQGFPVVVGLKWFDNFRTDKDGWLPARGRGGYGGHALLAYGLEQRAGVWGLKIRNSWGPAWGVGGNCVIPEPLFDGWIGGFWAIGSVVRTPEPFPPSEPAKRARLSVSPADVLQLAP